MGVEIRWFFEGSMPAEVASWFRGEALGELLAGARARTDVYLITPDKNLGIKLREGRLEVKWRQRHEPFAAGEQRIEGHAECWCKWTWKDREGTSDKEIMEDLRQGGDTPWIEVAKEREQRKYRLAEDGFIPVPVKDRTARGYAIELTKLRIRYKPWWSLAADVFGEEEEAMGILHQGTETLLATYPGPELRTENSMGYPEWLWVAPDTHGLGEKPR